MTDFFGTILLGRVAEESFYVGDGLGHAVGGETGQEGLAVALSCDSWVEEDRIGRDESCSL